MKIFIAGSSHDDIDNKYIEAANLVSKMISKNNTVIIGGIPKTFPKNSMMGVYDKNFRKSEYITVKKYDAEIKPDTSKVLYYTMDRTKEIFLNADLIIFMPGGLGTLAEISSMLEEERTNPTNKKILLYNLDGFYDEILNFLKKSINESFIYESDINKLKVVSNLEELKKECKNILD